MFNLDDEQIVSWAKACATNAQNKMSKLTGTELSLPGMSGKKGRHLLNNVCSRLNLNYLEIGLWQGSTFCSSLYANELNAVGIDNWSEFDGPKKQFDSHLKKYMGRNKVKIYDDDCFKIALDEIGSNIDGKFDVYFYDGGHSTDEQYRALTHFDPILADTHILIVDDWQQLEVQRGTLFAQRDLKHEILWEYAYRSIDADAENWWCGFYISVIKKHK